MKNVFTIIGIFVSTFTFSQSSIQTSNMLANIYDIPDVTSKVINTIPAQTTVPLKGMVESPSMNDKYFQVVYNGKTGWVYNISICYNDLYYAAIRKYSPVASVNPLSPFAPEVNTVKLTSVFSQKIGPWETLYKDNQLSIEVLFITEPGSCLNSVKNKIQYRLNGKLNSLDYYLIWTTDYKDCNGNIFFQEHSLNISSGNTFANGSDDALGDTWPSIEDEFFADKVLVKFYNVHTSSSPSNLSGIKR